MEYTPILPNIGTPCRTDLLNDDQLEDASIGEMMHAMAILAQVSSRKMANPITFTEVTTFSRGAGSDWSGYHPQTKADESEADESGSKQGKIPAEVLPPDRYYDSLPAMGDMLSQINRAADLMMANYTRYFQAVENQQVAYFGAPYDTSGYRDAKQYLRDTMQLSAATATKHVDRAAYVTAAPGKNPEEDANVPVFARMAASFINGRVPAENVDRFISLDQELTDYADSTGQTTDYKNAVLQAFEPTLVETAETSTPDEVSKVKKRWVDRIAHAMNADGPSPSQTLRKQPDNAIKTRDNPDGSGHISMHATPDLYAKFKNFGLHMLNHNGTPPAIPDAVAALFPTNNRATEQAEDDEENSAEPVADASASDATSVDIDEQQTTLADDSVVSALEAPTDSIAGTPPAGPLGSAPLVFHSEDGPFPDPNLVVAEDEQGNPVTAQHLNTIDRMSNGQKLGAMLIGMFTTLLSMDPNEVGIKKSHGSGAQLVLVQDIQTAHHTLGLPDLPAAAQRPPGAEGMLPPVITAPNPNRTGPPDCHGSSVDFDDFEPPPDDDFEPPHGGYVNPVPWTPYQSEVLNHGPMHPKDAEILACNAELVGQIWNGPDTVLNQKRTQRLFTPTQRRAILARDRGCMAPGCTIPGIYSEIHHIKEWEHGGDTDERNAICLCAHHHSAIHIGKWRIVKHHRRTFFQPAPWLDPYQPLLRNVYWNT